MSSDELQLGFNPFNFSTFVRVSGKCSFGYMLSYPFFKVYEIGGSLKLW